MKKSKYTKFEIESTPGTWVDASKHFRNITLYDRDGNPVETSINESRLMELDEKYDKLLADIVNKTTGAG